MLNDREYEAVYNSIPEDIDKMHTLEDYRTRHDGMLETAGAFVKYAGVRSFMGSYVVSGESSGDYQSANDLIIARKTNNMAEYKYIYVILTAEFETGEITYTVVLTPDMELAELNFSQNPPGEELENPFW